MKHINIYKQALLHSVAVVIYVIGVVAIMSNMEQLSIPKESFLIPVIVLLLLVVSVAVMAVLIFVRPIIWYLAGSKKEAIKLFASILLIIVIIVAVLVLIIGVNGVSV